MSSISNIIEKIKFRIETYRSTPNFVRERWRFGLKRALRPNINFPIWVTTKSGAKILLDDDVVDEAILSDLSEVLEDIYFPGRLSLKPGDVVLDVGGHHGLYAVELLARFPGIRILSIEPDPDGVGIIRKHIDKNRAVLNIRVVPQAIGMEEKQGFLVDNDDGSWGKTVENVKKQDSISVQVVTLKHILEPESGQIKLVKSNCEGGEFDLVPQLIALNIRPDLIILMIHPDRGDMEGLIMMLSNYGYEGRIVRDYPTNPCWHFEPIHN